MSDDVVELRAAVKLALDRLREANRRFINRHDMVGEGGSPERREYTKTLALIWDAITLLDPDGSHPDDAAEARAAIMAEMGA
jgi:hypothetical protein